MLSETRHAAGVTNSSSEKYKRVACAISPTIQQRFGCQRVCQ